MPLSETDEELLRQTYASVELDFSTGQDPIDDILRGIIGIFERVFPGRISAYYLAGSYGEGTAVATSDIDFHPLFEDSFVSPDERALARQMGWLCDLLSPLDIAVVPQNAGAPQGYGGLFKYKCRRVYGRALDQQWTTPPFANYLAGAMRNDEQRVARDQELLLWPVDYPKPDDEFYGYIHGNVFSLDGYRGPGTKTLINYLYGMLIPLVSQQTQEYVIRKSDAFQLYQEHIDDKWAPFVGEVWESCRVQWQYRLPQTAPERARLRALCRQTRAFENHFLAVSSAFWLDRLRAWTANGQGNIATVLDYLGTVALPDGQAAAALKDFHSADERVVQRAARTRQKLERARRENPDAC
ncbi:MAG: hypothetical protein GKR89_01810 [Candidatus Latescibacteria bacterium]|nr:hypothetical protein [Candidatus Latescibacterota bacterium]